MTLAVSLREFIPECNPPAASQTVASGSFLDRRVTLRPLPKAGQQNQSAVAESNPPYESGLRIIPGYASQNFIQVHFNFKTVEIKRSRKRPPLPKLAGLRSCKFDPEHARSSEAYLLCHGLMVWFAINREMLPAYRINRKDGTHAR